MEKRISGMKEKKADMSTSSAEEENSVCVIDSNNDSSENQSHPALPVDNNNSFAGNETIVEESSEFKASDGDIMKTINESLRESSNNAASKIDKIRSCNDLTICISSANYDISSTSKDLATESDRNHKNNFVRPWLDQPRQDKDDELPDKANNDDNNDPSGGMDDISINAEHDIHIRHPTEEKRISEIKEKKADISTSSSEEENPAVIIDSYNDPSADQSHPALPVDNDKRSAGNDTVTEDDSEVKASDSDILKPSNETNKIVTSNHLTNSVSSANYAIPSTSKHPPTVSDNSNGFYRPWLDQPRQDKDDMLPDKADNDVRNDHTPGGIDGISINIEHEIHIQSHAEENDKSKRRAILSSLLNDQCGICSKSVISGTEFSHHYMKCLGKNHQCQRCKKSFRTKQGLSYHKGSRICDTSYKSKRRENTVSHFGSLAPDNHIHTNERPHISNTSGESFTGGDTESDCKQNHDNDEPHQSNQSAESSLQVDSLSDHGCKQSGSKLYKYTISNKSFANNSNLSRHKRTHAGENKYTCTICGKLFAQSSTGDQHERTHTGEKPSKCTKCEKSFTTSSDLKDHERTHTGKKPYEREICGKSFASSNTRSTHESSHTGDKRYECTICGKAFAQSGDLSRHERIHTGEKPYKCKICGKLFAQSGNRGLHERTHTKEKPYKCTFCDKSFTSSSDRKKHERTHTREKPYKCTLCDKSFTTSSDRQRHERTHTKYKPYECNICRKSFTQSSDLSRHLRLHTGEKPYKCQQCGECFTRRADMIKHQNKLCKGAAKI